MVFVAPVISTTGQFGWDSVNPIAKVYGYNRFGLQKRAQFIDAGGLRGVLAQQSENRAQSIIPVNGPVGFTPTHSLLSTIALQAIFGGTPTGTGTMTYPFANAFYPTYMAIDRGSLGVDTYGFVYINRATFTSEQGGPLELELECVAQTETTGAAGSFPQSGVATNYPVTGGLQYIPPFEPPFTHSNSATTFTAISVARQIERVQWTFDFHITEDRYFNSQTLQTPAKQEVTCQVAITTPATSDYSDIFSLATAGTNSGVGAWNDGTHTLTFTAGNLQLASTPIKEIAGKGENKAQITFDVMRLGIAEFIAVTMN